MLTHFGAAKGKKMKTKLSFQFEEDSPNQKAEYWLRASERRTKPQLTMMDKMQVRFFVCS